MIAFHKSEVGKSVAQTAQEAFALGVKIPEALVSQFKGASIIKERARVAIGVEYVLDRLLNHAPEEVEQVQASTQQFRIKQIRQDKTREEEGER